jgi:anthranilate synthase component 1
MVRLEENKVELRPIAGTRRRGRTVEEDQAMEEELKKDPKERAEHIMLVDLARNDLGRICRSGTIRVHERMTLEDYSHELKLRDALSLVFDSQGDVDAGSTFRSVVRGGIEEGDGALLTRVHLAPERLDAASSHADIIPFASQREVDVTITAATFTDANLVVSADVAIAFVRTDADPGNAREGAFTGRFIAPVVSERTAEQNLALLDIADVLGVPLASRPVSP